MSLPYVCLRCFRQVSRRNGQIRNSSFVSLRENPNPSNSHELPVQKEERPADSPAESNNTYRRKRKRVPFYKQYQEQQKPTGIDQVLENLFLSTSHQEGSARVSRSSQKSEEQQSKVPAKRRVLSDRLLELRGLLHRRASSLDDIWVSCQQILGETDWKNGPKLSAGDSMVFRDILLAACSKQQVVNEDTVATPANIIETYRKHGVMRYWWHNVIWAHLAEVVQLNGSAVNVMSEGDAKKRIAAILQKLIQVWCIFIENYRAPGLINPLETDAQISTSPSENKLPQKEVDEFLHLLPRHPKISLTRSLSSAAVVTNHYLDMEDQSYLPLLGEFFQKIPPTSGLDIGVTRTALSDARVPFVKVNQLLKSLQADFGYLTKRLALNRDESEENGPDSGLKWSKKQMSMRMSDISTALENTDAEDISNLWANYLSSVKTDKSIDKPTNDWILAQFLSAFWTQRYSNQAIQVWNHIIKSGNTPALMHWTAMLTGCAQARDVTSLKGIWTNMIRYDVKPDIHAWTAYIHGLIKNHRWQEGFHALEALGKTWKGPPAVGTPGALSADTRYRPPPAYITPTIAPVHAALSALVDIQKPDLIPTIIAWAKSQNLHFETYTFNILLKLIVRSGTQAQIQAHLSQMAEHDCAPDVVTFTMILNGLVSNEDSDFRTLPSEVQESRIESLLTEMENKGVSPTPHTYAVLLEGLLGSERTAKDGARISSVNITVARAVLSHMRAQNILPNKYIYTIFVEHYFRSTPPDIQAIDSLWASIQQEGKKHHFDPIFYDRMIEGYADVDKIEKALVILRMMPNEGKSPGWTALWRVLAALERAWEWDMCKELMRDIVDQNEGLLRHGQSSWDGKSQFYELVDEIRKKGINLDGEEQE